MLWLLPLGGLTANLWPATNATIQHGQIKSNGYLDYLDYLDWSKDQVKDQMISSDLRPRGSNGTFGLWANCERNSHLLWSQSSNHPRKNLMPPGCTLVARARANKQTNKQTNTHTQGQKVKGAQPWKQGKRRDKRQRTWVLDFKSPHNLMAYAYKLIRKHHWVKITELWHVQDLWSLKSGKLV